MLNGESSSTFEDEKETGRTEAFSDGIFAIAITLLILNIKVPPADQIHAQHVSLLDALLREWPAYFSYLNSFMTILIMWVNHHKLFQQIRRTDHVFLLLNGVLLMGVTFVPFPTAVLAEYIDMPEAEAAAALYNGTFFLIAILYYVLWLYASRGQRLLARSHNAKTVAAISRQYQFGPPLYFIAFVLAFVNVWAGVGMCTALAVFFAFPGIQKKTRPEPAIEAPRRSAAR